MDTNTSIDWSDAERLRLLYRQIDYGNCFELDCAIRDGFKELDTAFEHALRLERNQMRTVGTLIYDRKKGLRKFTIDGEFTPLSYAILSGAQVRTVRRMINLGVDVHERSGELNCTAVHAVAGRVIGRLITSGNLEPHFYDYMNLLIDAGADVYSKDDKGRTALSVLLEMPKGYDAMLRPYIQFLMAKF